MLETVFKNPHLYSQTVHNLTDVITHDIFSPPVASRIYAYSNLAAFEVMASKSQKYKSLAGQLKGLEPVLKPSKTINTEYTTLLAFMNIGEELTFSKDSTQKIMNNLTVLAQVHGMPEDVIKNSQEYAKLVSGQILAWSKKDQYAQTRSASKHTVNNDEGFWIPTPPAYFQAIEPHWMKIRTIAIDSANQFMPKPPTKFSKDKKSDFYKLANEVYEIGTNLSVEQKAIADFWDCNGFKLNVIGHAMFATKAMTPGGHWMGITGIVSENKKADFHKTVYSYTGVSLAIMDAFIACWNTKFHYNLLRPETYINSYMDDNWRPYLQTPPFAEYTSGHSIISNASAKVLTRIYGEHTAFRDSTERRWGWPDRSYNSVNEAAMEASMSRLYGGIHFREALETGMKEGDRIGEFVFNKLKMTKEKPAGQKMPLIKQINLRN